MFHAYSSVLQVNSVEVSHLTTPELLALLMGPGQTFSLRLYREASLTLL